MRTQQLPARGGSYVERLTSRYEVQASGCWRWTGTMMRVGYGQIARHGRNVPAHRAMWEHMRGPIPAGLCIDHVCGNRACVNPDPAHLEVVTYRVNNLRRFSRSGANKIQRGRS